jgi:Delta7-sterol 5-desaturase
VTSDLLLTWLGLYAALAAIYLGLGRLLVRINATPFGRARRIQNAPPDGRAPGATEQRRHALLSLGVIAGLLGTGITLQHHGLALFAPIDLDWTTAIVGIALSVVLYDAAFYWTHRWLHTPWLFRHVHGYHHRVRTPEPWTTNSETVLDGLFLNLYWLAAPLLLPIPAEILVLHRLWDMAMGVLGHSGHEYGGLLVRPPSPLVGVTHHDQHHRHARCNYGVHFTLWDRLMGTLHASHDDRVRALSGARPRVPSPD